MAKLTSGEGEWFRRQHQLALKENRQLRAVIEQYCLALEQGGLSGSLLAKELRNRVAKVPSGQEG